MVTAKPQGRIRVLDGLRGISVLAVILFHVSYFSMVITSSPAFVKVVRFMAPTGVQVFFVISGFIITKLMLEEFRKNGSVSMSRFYTRRFFRIIPAYWFYTLVVCVLGASGVIALNASSVICSLLFISNMPIVHAEDTGSWFMAHTWSLSVEEQYYLLFPWIIWVVLRGNVKWATVVLACFYLVAVSSLKIMHEVDIRFPAAGFDLSFLRSFKYIIAGVIIALHQTSLGGLARRTSFVLPLTLAFFVCMEGMGFTSFHGIDDFFEVTDAMIMAFIVLWIIENPGQCRWLLWAPLLWVGDCSYSLYLWQQLFTGLSKQYIGLRLNVVPYSLFLIVGCAAISLYVIEKPFIRLGRTILRRWDAKILPVQTAVEPSV